MNVASPALDAIRWRRWTIQFAIMGSLAVALVIPCIWYGDTPLAREFASAELPGDLEKGLQVAEVFAHGSGVISLLVTLWWIDMTHRRMIGYAATLTGLSSLVANALKNIFTRVRPHSGDSIDAGESWMPMFEGSFWESSLRSFPSGHSATAVGLAIGLSIVYPRGRYLFAFFASLACVQRIHSQAHYPSDVLAGVGIAFLCCALVMFLRPARINTKLSPPLASS